MSVPLPRKAFFSKTPHPSLNSLQLILICFFKCFGPLPSPSWAQSLLLGEYGYFLELHTLSKIIGITYFMLPNYFLQCHTSPFFMSQECFGLARMQRKYLIIRNRFRLGSRVGAVVRALAFHQCVPGSIPGLGVICGLSLLVLYSAPRGFSPGTPVFPSPQKPPFDLIYLIWFIWFTVSPISRALVLS